MRSVVLPLALWLGVAVFPRARPADHTAHQLSIPSVAHPELAVVCRNVVPGRWLSPTATRLLQHPSLEQQ